LRVTETSEGWSTDKYLHYTSYTFQSKVYT
jgi:hypothetical protein